MITHEDIIRFIKESPVQMSISEQLEVWEIDEEAFDNYVLSFTNRAIAEFVKMAHQPHSGRLLIFTALWSGFEMGYKCAMELETRRQVGN